MDIQEGKIMGATIEFFKKYGKCIPITETCRDPRLAKFPPIICKDGMFISVQAGENYKCYPRQDLDNFEYETVEVYKNESTEAEELLNMFECAYDNYIYDNVPVEVIDAIIEKHGGFDYSKINEYIEERK